MQVYNLSSKNKTDKLILFFAGWGMDQNPFMHLRLKDCDIAILYDYNSFKIDNQIDFSSINPFSFSHLLDKYKEIYLIAWSMGVWASSYFFNNFLNELDSEGRAHNKNSYMQKIKKCIAINGSLCPISDICGIPANIYQGTIDNLPNGLDKFNLRMCSGKSLWLKYKEIAAQRDMESIKNELISIREQYSLCHTIKWNKVIISERDNIFPSENLVRFWTDYKSKIEKQKDSTNIDFEIALVEQSHFPFLDSDFSFDKLLEI